MSEATKRAEEWMKDFSKTNNSEAFDAITALLAENAAQAATIEKYKKGLDAVASPINNSEGVTGLHLNGDIAPWCDLQSGGYFEYWLMDFDDAIAADAPVVGLVLYRATNTVVLHF
jgi:hypothetical protein